MTDGKESIHPRQSKEFSNQLCLQYGLSITETKADPNRIPAWKEKLRCDIKRAMELCYDREQFIRCMEAWGYGVKWEEAHHLHHPGEYALPGQQAQLLWQRQGHLSKGGRPNQKRLFYH